jgi:hypothetical protein
LSLYRALFLFLPGELPLTGTQTLITRAMTWSLAPMSPTPTRLTAVMG